MSKLKNLLGQKFGRLTVIARAENTKQGSARWLCRCDCGREVVVIGHDLLSKHTAGCGCLAGQHHGMTDTKIYNVWRSIKQRCMNPTTKNYHNYGGRGIALYEPWQDDFQTFYNFVSQLEHFGEPHYSLDRIDNNGNYEPDNLRFVTHKEQNRNQRTNIIVEYKGELMCLKDAAKASGIPYNTLYGRYQRGDRGERLFRPVR